MHFSLFLTCFSLLCPDSIDSLTTISFHSFSLLICMDFALWCRLDSPKVASIDGTGRNALSGIPLGGWQLSLFFRWSIIKSILIIERERTWFPSALEEACLDNLLSACTTTTFVISVLPEQRRYLICALTMLLKYRGRWGVQIQELAALPQ